MTNVPACVPVLGLQFCRLLVGCKEWANESGGVGYPGQVLPSPCPSAAMSLDCLRVSRAMCACVQVRLAVHHLSQRKVAVKVIDKAKLTDPNEAKRMQREIRVMKHLSHQVGGLQRYCTA